MDYKPNSNKFKKEQQEGSVNSKKKVEKVVNGTVKAKKKSGIHKAANAFLAEDVDSVTNYVWKDVLVPTIKDTFVKIVKTTIEMLVYGDEPSKHSTSASRVSYGSYYNGSRSSERRSRTIPIFEYDDIIFDSRGDAEEVLISMCDMIDEFDLVSVGDLYDLAGITAPYTANSYGWEDLRNARAVRVQDGWMLKLPKAKLLR